MARARKNDKHYVDWDPVSTRLPTCAIEAL